MANILNVDYPVNMGLEHFFEFFVTASPLHLIKKFLYCYMLQLVLQ